MIDTERLQSLAMGAAVLSAGGGSFPYLEHLRAREMIAAGANVELLGPDSLSDDARVALVAMVGAPLVMLERLADTEHFANAVRGLSGYLSHGFDAVMGFEIGCLNAMIPILVAGTLDLPLVDADTVGRSFPQINMSSFAIAGVSMTPFVLSDIRQNEVIVSAAANGEWSETLMRASLTALGSVAGIASCVTGKTIKAHAIHGTFSRAIRLGEAILHAQRRHGDVVESLLCHTSGLEIARGRVSDINRRVEGGFVCGKACVQPIDGEAPVTIDFQNEYSVVSRNGHIISTVPDLICIIDTVRGEPVGTEALRYAQQVAVVSIPAMPEHLTPQGMAAVGPRAFGYEFDHHTPHGLGVRAC